MPGPWALTERKAAAGGPGPALPSSQDNACGCTATASRKCLGEARWPTAQEDKRSRQALRFSFQQSLNRGPNTRSKLAGSCGTLNSLVKKQEAWEELPGRDEVRMGLNSQRCSPRAQPLSRLLAVTVLSPWIPDLHCLSGTGTLGQKHETVGLCSTTVVFFTSVDTKCWNFGKRTQDFGYDSSITELSL